jgi:3-phosphoshikimate 1-carboxyvinyltransferase
MTVTVKPSRLGGRIEAIASKTHAHRLLISAALYGKGTKINCSTFSEDILATADCLRGLGARVLRQPYGFYVENRIHRKSFDITAEAHRGAPLRGRQILDCSESGSTYRFLLPVACALGLSAAFMLGGRLPQRPMDEFFRVLEEKGAVIEGKGTPELKVSGQLVPGVYELPGDISSQYISGLLFALPLLEGESEIRISRSVESKGYIEATLSVLSRFGIELKLEGNRIKINSVYRERALSAPNGTNNPKGKAMDIWDRITEVYTRAVESCSCGADTAEFDTEGDWSNAAFWLVMGAVSGSPVTVTGLSLGAVQGDREICEIIRRFGGEVRAAENEITASSSGELRGISLDASDIPDLVPAVAVLAAKAEGETRIVNASRLRLKESDRLSSIAATLNALGGRAEETEDGLLIHGGGLRGGNVDSFNDHRIAMMAAVASNICTEPVTITRAEAVNKSYPGFFTALQSLGGGVSFL